MAMAGETAAEGPKNCLTYAVSHACDTSPAPGYECGPGTSWGDPGLPNFAAYCSGGTFPIPAGFTFPCGCLPDGYSPPPLPPVPDYCLTTAPAGNTGCNGEGTNTTVLGCACTLACTEWSCSEPTSPSLCEIPDDCSPDPTCAAQSKDGCNPVKEPDTQGVLQLSDAASCNTLGSDPLVVSSRAAITDPHSDFTFDGPTPLSMARSYRSNDRSVVAYDTPGPLGRGWRHEWESSLRCATFGTGGNGGMGATQVLCSVRIGYSTGVRLHGSFGGAGGGDGGWSPELQEYVQVYTAESDPFSPNRAFAKMVRRPGPNQDFKGDFVVYFQDGRVATFGTVCDCTGTSDYCKDPVSEMGTARLKSLVDARGRLYRLAYDAPNGVLVSVKDEWDHELALKAAPASACGPRVATALEFREDPSPGVSPTTVATYDISGAYELLAMKRGAGTPTNPYRTIRSYEYAGNGRLTAVRNESGKAIVEFGYAPNGDAIHVADEKTDLDVTYAADPATQTTTASYTARAVQVSTGSRRTSGGRSRGGSSQGGVGALSWNQLKVECTDSGKGRIDWYTYDEFMRRTSRASYEKPPGFVCAENSRTPPAGNPIDYEIYEYVLPKTVATVSNPYGSFAIGLPLSVVTRVTRASTTQPGGTTSEVIDFNAGWRQGDPPGYACGVAALTEGRLPCRRTVGLTVDAAGLTVNAGATTFYSYDLHGRLIRTIGPVDVSSAPGSELVPVEARTYWPDNAAAANRGRASTVTRFATRALQQSATATIDSTDPALSYGIEWDIFGPYIVSDPDGRQTRYLRDGDPRVTRRVGPDGSTVDLTYYDDDKPSVVLFSTGAARRAAYDSRGRLSRIDRIYVPAGGDPRTVPAADSQVVQFDAAGNPELSTRVNAQGDVRWKRPRKYNGEHMLGSEAHPEDPTKTAIWTYDPSGILRTILDEEGRRIEFAPDAIGRPHTVTRRTPESSADQLSTAVATFAYESGTDLIRTVTDGAGRTTTYVRDDFGRVVNVDNAAAFKGGAIGHAFDARGNPLTRIGGGSTTTYTWDGLDRLTSIHAVSSSGAARVDVDLTYDGPGQKGRLWTISESGRTTTYTWDASGRLRGETLATGGAPRATAWRYDVDGYLDTIVYPSGLAVTYDRNDATKEVTAVREAGTSRGFVTEVAREPFGPVKSGWFGNGLPLSQTFNLRYEPVSVTSGPVSLSYGMSYAGEVAGVIEGVASPGFTYDHLSRLATVVGGARPGESLQYEYAGDRITGAKTIGGSPVRRLAFGYDDQSNLSYVTAFDASGAVTKTICLVHDALGRMTLAGERFAPLATPDGTGCQVESEVVLPLARFGYDALNRRVTRTDATGTTYFAFSPAGEPLGEYRQVNGAWQAVREYVWLDGRPVAQEEHPSATERYTYFVHVDHIGLPRALTNQSGQEVWRATARPYGDIDETSFTDPLSGRAVVTNLRLPGQYDERLFSAAGIDLKGPYYNWNRWYLPSMGRYLELDPIAKAGGFNGFYGPNWYGYAEGNPTSLVDPDGSAGGPFVPEPTGGPPFPVPGGGPDNGWQFNPDPGNGRGGSYGPRIPVPGSQPSASWDPLGRGHWDLEDGSRTRSWLDRWGNRIDGRQHAPRPFPGWKDFMKMPLLIVLNPCWYGMCPSHDPCDIVARGGT
jgi:RHS repeat-associated protein